MLPNHQTVYYVSVAAVSTSRVFMLRSIRINLLDVGGGGLPERRLCVLHSVPPL